MVLDADNNVIIDNAAHIAALDVLRRAWSSSAPTGAAQVDWAAAQNLFNQGKTAMTRFWAHAYRQIPEDSPRLRQGRNRPDDRRIRGSRRCPRPLVPVGAPRPARTPRTPRSSSSAPTTTTTSDWNPHSGLAARKSAFETYQDKPGYESFEPLIATLNADATATRPSTEKWQQIVDTVLVPTLQKAVAGGDTTALLAEAKTKVQALIK